MRRISSCFMVTLLAGLLGAGSVLAQQPPEKEFPQAPQRTARIPDVSQRNAMDAFLMEHASWQVRWNRTTGTPASLRGPGILLESTGAQEAIRFMLDTFGGAFNFAGDVSDLRLDRSRTTVLGTHLRFAQVFQGVPIEDATLNLHLNNRGELYYISGDYFPDLQALVVVPTIAGQQAAGIAAMDLEASDLTVTEVQAPELVLLPFGEELVLVWKVLVITETPATPWKMYVAASNGRMLTGQNMSYRDSASGTVYDHYPDENHEPVTRTLVNLKSPGTSLESIDLKVLNDDDSEAYETDGTFYYWDDDDSHFDEVMVYYHGEKFRDDFLESLGLAHLTYWSSPQTQVVARVHYGSFYPYAEAWPSLNPPQLRFGDGNGTTKRDLAKEESVIYHEYMHLATYDIVGGNMYDPGEERALNEAISDYMANSFAGDPDFEEWVYITDPPLRTSSNNFSYAYWDTFSSDHGRSQIFSGALWDIREDLGLLGGSLYYADQLTFDALDHLDLSVDFMDGRDAVLAADLARYSGVNEHEIRVAFWQHGIGEAVDTPEITWARWELIYEYWGTRLKWTRNPEEDEVTRYQVVRKVLDGSWQHLAYVDQPQQGSEVQLLDIPGRNPAEYYHYKVRAESEEGVWSPYSDYAIVYTVEEPLEASGAALDPSLPAELTLQPNFPNPFNPSTQIRFGLASSSHVRLRILNTRGQLVRELVDEVRPPGWHSVTWDGRGQSGRDVASGIYLYVLEAEGKRLLRKMLIIR